MNLLDYYEYCHADDPQAQRLGFEHLRPKWGRETLGMMMRDLAGLMDERNERAIFATIGERMEHRAARVELCDEEDDG